MMVINGRFEPQATRIVQSVQFRVYRKVGRSAVYRFSDAQTPVEFVTRRAGLLRGDAGGFHAMGPDEAEYQIYSFPPGNLKGPMVLSTCGGCHSGEGVFSVNTYSGALSRLSPDYRLPPTTDPRNEDSFTVGWKLGQFDWGLFRGILEAADAVGPH